MLDLKQNALAATEPTVQDNIYTVAFKTTRPSPCCSMNVYLYKRTRKGVFLSPFISSVHSNYVLILEHLPCEIQPFGV